MTEMEGMHDRRSGARGRRAAPAAVALLLAAGACGVGDVTEGGAHEPVAEIDVVDARRETAEREGPDAFVLAPLMSPQTPGRIIYDEPVSLAEVTAADTLVRQESTGTTAPRSSGGSGRGGAARDTSRASQPGPERR